MVWRKRPGRGGRDEVHRRYADDDRNRRLAEIHRLAQQLLTRRKGGRRAALALVAAAFVAFVAVAYAHEPAALSGEVMLPAVPYGTVADAAPTALVGGPPGATQLSNPNGVSRYLAANDTTGWIRRDSLGGYNAVNTHLVVSTTRFTASLYRLGKPIFSARVGVGQSRWPTPTGRFYIRNKLTRYSSPVYGPLAFGTSARSAVLTDWPAGGFVGIHGTNQPGLIPGRISHGCIRLRNADILRLAELMPPGTPLTIS